MVDAPIPGTAVFDRLRSDPRVWHFAFHGARDLPELLVAGRERQYLQYFFDARTTNPSATDVDVYASAYSAPGAMRAGFEVYRAFEQDARDNRAALEAGGKLTVPVLAVGGERSRAADGRDAARGRRGRDGPDHPRDRALDPRGGHRTRSWTPFWSS